jgi:hypothetical protein
VKHFATPEFWKSYEKLPPRVQRLADQNFQLIKTNPRHPSLHFKRIGRYWSARVGLHFRALGVDADDGVVWFWIGSHAEYDSLIGP